ncbi:GNAT family N-acetyltransferase [Demequina phytophila]|uniref:GNAT family N-acetyltransferase n=1 Tax=Demequina phytophila TaxID=1638981 RepID=UPI0007806D18|nr:GNAT family N-acetyltransferase [Demequina phytophila]
MPLTLVPIPASRFSAWQARCQAEYAADLVAAGEPPSEADRHAAESLAESFPSGAPTAHHAVFDLVHEVDGVVGYLWIGPDRSEDEAAWWVWDVVVEPGHRGKGYGRTAMLLAEDHARAAGARTLGLSVFGHNETARRLYESVGYDVTTVKMRKAL